jgi:uncharacterized protein (TIRG00374 family)
MSETDSSFLKRHWKLLLNIFTIVALAGLAYAIRDQIAQTFKDLERVNVWVLLLMIPIEALNYHAQAKTYQHLFEVVGTKLRYWVLYGLSVEINFINHVFPSGGVSGISYFGIRLRSEGVKVTKSTLVHTMKLMLLFLSFEIFIIFGMLALAVEGHANNLVILIGSSISTLLIVGTLVFFYLLGSKERINTFFGVMTRWLNRLIQVFRRNNPETINTAAAHRAFDEFHTDYMTLRSHWKEMRAPFLYSLLANATEIAALYAVYIAFGEYVNIGAVILAYAIANFAGLISVLPGGIGIYEALMTTVLATAGVPAAVSLPITIMYRVMNVIIQVPPGYILYHRSLRRGATPVNADNTHAA